MSRSFRVSINHIELRGRSALDARHVRACVYTPYKPRMLSAVSYGAVYVVRPPFLFDFVRCLFAVIGRADRRLRDANIQDCFRLLKQNILHTPATSGLRGLFLITCRREAVGDRRRRRRLAPPLCVSYD
ncbi:hypothetical protein EVAR_77347_1 [Eumeta japonica]|uniref:Uncharacterized protein n=1 Tax=Eumeta variegata TaxID=151549 RepID=A0A4C1UYM0_EUMVA|nr:hypothetical protein EVAR_77347_1 [Eumeta japonica]